MFKSYVMPLYKLDQFKEEWKDSFEPHSDEIITSDQGYVDVAQQIESMMLAGQLLQESRPNTRNMSFDYEDDDSAMSDFSDVSAVDRRGADIVDLTREADNLRDRVNQAYRNALEAKNKQNEPTPEVKNEPAPEVKNEPALEVKNE